MKLNARTKPHPTEQFSAWEPCAPPVAIEPPCTCIELGEGVVLSDGCAKHDASKAREAGADAPALEARP